MADPYEDDIAPSRRELIKKTAWVVPAIASFSLVSSSPAGAYSRRPSDSRPPSKPGHGGNQTYPPEPGHGTNQTYPPEPGYGTNQTHPPKPGYGTNQTIPNPLP